MIGRSGRLYYEGVDFICTLFDDHGISFDLQPKKVKEVILKLMGTTDSWRARRFIAKYSEPLIEQKILV